MQLGNGRFAIIAIIEVDNRWAIAVGWKLWFLKFEVKISVVFYIRTDYIFVLQHIRFCIEF